MRLLYYFKTEDSKKNPDYMIRLIFETESDIPTYIELTKNDWINNFKWRVYKLVELELKEIE